MTVPTPPLDEYRAQQDEASVLALDALRRLTIIVNRLEAIHGISVRDELPEPVSVEPETNEAEPAWSEDQSPEGDDPSV